MKFRLIIVCLLLSGAALILRSTLYSQSWPVEIYYNPPAPEVSESPSAKGSDPIDNELFSKLDLNTATEEQLMLLPHIGEVLASRIVQYREVLGSYTELSQLTQIKGISDSILEQISSYLCIGNA